MDQANHFRRLPAELLVCILTMLADLKSLCKCSLVSKHFASAVFCVKSVSVTIPIPRGGYQGKDKEHCNETRKKILQAPLIFLQKFRELGSIYLEFNYLGNSNPSSVIKWKVKFGTNFPDIEKFVGFVYMSAQKEGEEPYQELLRQNFVLTKFKLISFYLLAEGRGCYTEWIYTIYMLAKSHTSLKRLIITDSGKKGKMAIGEEQLVKIRSVQEPVQRLFQFPPGVEIFSTPLLQLPLSGNIHQVNLLIFTCPPEANSGAIDEIVSWDFEDEEKVFGEAIKEIYKNHRDEFGYKALHHVQ